MPLHKRLIDLASRLVRPDEPTGNVFEQLDAYHPDFGWAARILFMSFRESGLEARGLNIPPNQFTTHTKMNELVPPDKREHFIETARALIKHKKAMAILAQSVHRAHQPLGVRELNDEEVIGDIKRIAESFQVFIQKLEEEQN